MHEARSLTLQALVIAALVGASVVLAADSTFMHALSSLLERNVLVSSVAFVLMLVIATVLAPVTVMPMIPVASVILGPFLVGTLSVVGWTLGAVIAFLIARHVGRPFLSRFLPIERIARYERLVPSNAQFLFVVILRIITPVDILSYALGLTLSMSLLRYTLATLIGVAWFSYAFAYMGDALFTHNVQALSVVGGVSLVLFVSGWYLILKLQKTSGTK